MADNPIESSSNPSHEIVGSETNASDDASAQDNLSVDQINAMLAAEDPEFLERLTELKELPSQAEDIESVEIDATQLENESVPTQGYSLKAGLLKLKLFVRGSPQKAVAGIKGSIKYLVAQLVLFGELGWFNKLKVLLIFFLVLGTLFVLLKFDDIATGKYFAHLFQISNLTSLEEVADEVYRLDPKQNWEMFSSPARRPNYYLLLPRIKIRLKSSGLEDHISFATFEVFLEANSIESGVEIRDKETEILDLIQRAGEKFSAEQLLTAQNKQKLKTEIRRGTNLIMKTGFIQEVYFNSILVSP